MSAVRELLERDSLGVGEAGARAGETITPGDLAELMGRFEQAARALQGTHETLRGEVSRLEGELREARGQLRRARDLAALGEMAAGIAHEIRNPLGSIRLYAEALVEDLADRPNERAIAGKVARAVDSLNAVVTDVLVFSREIRVHAEETEVVALCVQAAESCAGVASSTGASIEVEGCEGAVVRCDPSLMHQALVNVVRNGCEAACEAGRSPRVVVTTCVRTVLDGEGRRVPMRALRVSDNGPGVPEEVRGRMFNPFFTTRHTGTGLGLAIVHRILDAHGGRVDIHDRGAGADWGENGVEEGGGAVVDLLLPEGNETRSRNGEQA